MRPTLSQDVLLLAIDERATYRTRGPVGIVLSGAMLCEAVYAGQLLLPGEPPGRRRHNQLAKLVLRNAKASVEQVAARLCTPGVVAPVEHTFLGFVRRRGYAVVHTDLYWQATQRLMSGLTPGSSPDPRTAALAVLCSLSGIARKLAPPPDEPSQREALAAHLNGLREVVGPAIAEVLDATRRAYRRSDSGGGADGSFVPTASHCYGDLGGGEGGDGGDGDGGGDGGGD